MPLSREELAAAEEMHKFVRQFETQIKPAQQWKWLMIPVMVNSLVQMYHSKWLTAGYIMLGAMLLALLVYPFQWAKLKGRYRRESALLKVLERDHRDELPWIKEEEMEAEVKKHLAALKELEQELANRHATL